MWVFMCVWRLCQAAGDTAGFIATTWVGEIIWILMPSLLPAALSDQDWVLGEAGCLGCQRAGLQLPPALYNTPPHTYTPESVDAYWLRQWHSRPIRTRLREALFCPLLIIVALSELGAGASCSWPRQDPHGPGLSSDQWELLDTFLDAPDHTYMDCGFPPDVWGGKSGAHSEPAWENPTAWLLPAWGRGVRKTIAGGWEKQPKYGVWFKGGL